MASYLAKALAVLSLVFFGAEVSAEESAQSAIFCVDDENAHSDNVLDLSFDTRIDFQNLRYDGVTADAASGFKGKYFMLKVDGSLMDDMVDYSWRQRLNRRKENSSTFDDTDWVWVRFNLGGWHLSGGKEVVLVGGWEYDRNPIDVYTFSVFWDNMPSYEFGFTASRDLGPADNLAFQFTQSPWHTREHNNMYAYNLMWTGHHGLYSALWSANLIEYLPGRYINFLAIGNKVTLGKFWLSLDLVNRAAAHQPFLMSDFSVMSELSWQPVRKWRFHIKYTFDDNHSGTDADFTVADGTHLNMFGGGAEFSLLDRRSHNLRLHANCFYAWGRNANALDAMQRRTAIASIGFRWHVDILRVKSR